MEGASVDATVGAATFAVFAATLSGTLLIAAAGVMAAALIGCSRGVRGSSVTAIFRTAVRFTAALRHPSEAPCVRRALLIVAVKRGGVAAGGAAPLRDTEICVQPDEDADGQFAGIE
jgi:hypothetical protein